MDAEADKRFKLVKTPNGWSFALRPADHESSAAAGCVALLLTVFFGMMAVAGFVLAYGALWAPTGCTAFVLAMIALVIVVAVITIVFVQQCYGSDELTLDADAIRLVRRFGPLSWGRTIRRAQVAQLSVVRRSWNPSAGPPGLRAERLALDGSGAAGTAYHALVADDEAGRRRTLVAYYPRRMLLDLAGELATRWKTLAVDPDLGEFIVGKLVVTEDTDVPTDIRDRLRPPIATKLEIKPLGERGVRFARRPGSVSRYGIGALVAGGTGALGWALYLAMQAANGMQVAGLKAERLFDAASVLFWGPFGVALLVGAVRLAAFGFILTVTSDGLALVVIGLLGRSRRMWRKDEIASLSVDTRMVHRSESCDDIRTRILIRRRHETGPVLFVARAEPDATVELLRKPTGAPDSRFTVVGRRTGPGPVEDEGPVSEGRYDYGLRQKTAAAGISPISRALPLIVGSDEDELLSNVQHLLTKPELEWVATTVRAVLGVPSSEALTSEVARNASPLRLQDGW